MQITRQYAREQPVPHSQPTAFVELMKTYERNYILIGQLLAGLAPDAVYAVGYCGRRYSIEYSLLERGPYTATILLTWNFLDRGGDPLVQPMKLRIRVYDDTRQAELYYSGQTARGTPGSSGGLEGKWLLNRFLNKVLVFLVKHDVWLA